MKKATLKRYLTEIEKLLANDNESLAAINLLRDKLAKLKEDNLNSTLELPVPEVDVSALAVFSDGGCRGNPGIGGWGAIIQDGQGELLWEGFGNSSETTNNRMELTGAIVGLEHALTILKQLNQLERLVVLFTDSKYVVEGINSWIDGWKRRGWKKSDNKPPENLELWMELDQLKSTFKKLEIRWVKGHAGHPQNERCDQLANQAMDQL
jgi:ribonuclease HI